MGPQGDRSQLTALLGEYAAAHPQESACWQRFQKFVDAQARCFDRDCFDDGHVTGSAWVVSPDRQEVLLTHHKKLNIWVQLGGHSDGNPDPMAVATTEAVEESGLEVRILSSRAFDLDIHLIPARKNDPQHYHYDVRFAFQAASRAFHVSNESHALAWVPITELATYTTEASMLRMQRKWLNYKLEDV